MTLRKHIGQFLILLMLVAQLALAQHATVHFLEDQYKTAQHQNHDPAQTDRHDKSKSCQICVTAKELGHLLTSADMAAVVTLLAAIFMVWPLRRNIKPLPVAFYSSRAPPSFLC